MMKKSAITAILFATGLCLSAQTTLEVTTPPRYTANRTTSILGQDWDAKAEGDKVLQRLITATGPAVKGAHDAEMVLIGKHAYIVSQLSDLEGGESARRHDMYASMSIVNIETLQVEAIIPIAHSGQTFDNFQLLPGSCFVPRIIQKDEKTLRCFFTSNDPDIRQSQFFYRDFDIASRTFQNTIHPVMMKTSYGTRPMQPFYFYECAWRHGLRKRPRDNGMCIFDAFKEIDGKTYTVINNFVGKQNSLAVLNETRDTFEIISHFNEPQNLQLSEAAVNRLPDGTWLAIIRNDGENRNRDNRNYAFNTSADGITWGRAEFLELIPNGSNSKPTLDKFNGVYYLGWQEETRVNRVYRSVFNIDVSTDGKTWQRKYRFESVNSFQYPAFHQHNGKIWLVVTQGDSHSTRKERIMFGLLE